MPPRRSWSRSGRSPRPTTPRSPSGRPSCSGPPPRSAGPGRGDTVFVTADRSVAAPVDAGFEDRPASTTSSRSAWPATTSRSTHPTFVRPRDRAPHLRPRRATSGPRSVPPCSTCCRPAYRRRRQPGVLPSRQLHVRPTGVPVADRRGRTGGHRRGVRVGSRFSRQRGDVVGPPSTPGAGDGPTGDRTARQQPQLPRAGRADDDRGRWEVSGTTCAGGDSCTCGCCDGAVDRTPDRVDQPAGLSTVRPTGSAPIPSSWRR